MPHSGVSSINFCGNQRAKTGALGLALPASAAPVTISMKWSRLSEPTVTHRCVSAHVITYKQVQAISYRQRRRRSRHTNTKAECFVDHMQNATVEYSAHSSHSLHQTKAVFWLKAQQSAIIPAMTRTRAKPPYGFWYTTNREGGSCL